MTIKVRLTNRTALLSDCTDEQYEKLQTFWSYSPKGLWFMPAYQATGRIVRERNENLKTLDFLRSATPRKQSRIDQLEDIVALQNAKLAKMWDGKIRFLKYNRLPSGLFRATRMECMQKLGISFDVRRDRTTLPFAPGLLDSNDYRYMHQDLCVAQMQIATRKGGGTILSATGTGKTRIAAVYFSRLTCQCLFVVDQLDLLHQQRRELEQWLGEPVGMVGESKFNVERVTVATIQTLSLHSGDPAFLRWYKRVQAMIVDEVHEQMGRRNFDVLEKISPAVIFGLTATLQMGQKEVRFKVFSFAGPVIFTFPILKGIKRGVLNPVKVLQLLFPEVDVGENDDLDYQADIQKQVVANEEKHTAVQAIVRLFYKEGRYSVVLVDRVAQLELMQVMLEDIGPLGIAYGTVGTDVRRKAIVDFEKGRIRQMLANKVFKKGINIKRVDSMVDMAEMKSKNDVVQKLGRTVRLHEDKGMGIYVDIGTQTGRYAKAATSRKRALVKAGFVVKTVKVQTADEAVTAVEKFLKKEVIDADEASDGREVSGSLFGND